MHMYTVKALIESIFYAAVLSALLDSAKACDIAQYKPECAHTALPCKSQ